ncbi:MAG TPA: diaminopimelate decarboxylase, partial [Nitrosomonas sp.]|nr:diaminopimelate decarboxylase [Nitrosomonas sp.]HNJ37731.1 diaminopimelate decarboxylase [Nitrosomonas sp.]
MSGFAYFDYLSDQLQIESVALSAIAQEFGTPCYVYSKAALTAAYQTFDQA